MDCLAFLEYRQELDLPMMASVVMMLSLADFAFAFRHIVHMMILLQKLLVVSMDEVDRN